MRKRDDGVCVSGLEGRVGGTVSRRLGDYNKLASAPLCSLFTAKDTDQRRRKGK